MKIFQKQTASEVKSFPRLSKNQKAENIMFQRLKHRFVVTTMSLLSGVFIAIILTVGLLTFFSNRQITVNMLQRTAMPTLSVRPMAQNNTKEQPPPSEDGFFMKPPSETEHSQTQDYSHTNPAADVSSPPQDNAFTRPDRDRKQEPFVPSIRINSSEPPMGGILIQLEKNEAGLFSPVSWLAPPQLEEGTIRDIVETALSKKKERGSFFHSNYWFAFQLVEDTETAAHLALIDQTDRMISLRQTLMILGGVSIVSLLLLYGVSHFFAERAVRPIRQAFAQQEAFVADASHELKTPLAILGANLSVLRSNSGETVASQMQWVNAMEDQTRRMNGLVGDMLTLARLDARADDIQAEQDFSRIVTGCLLSFEAICFEKEISLESNVASGLRVTGNAEHFTRLVYILLDNAAKHTPQGGKIRITLQTEKNRVQLQIYNTGQGIPPEQTAHIFDRFYRSDAARLRNGEHGGYGLGLAIARSIAEEAGGGIGVSSEPGQFCAFVVEFPHSHHFRTTPYHRPKYQLFSHFTRFFKRK